MCVRYISSLHYSVPLYFDKSSTGSECNSISANWRSAANSSFRSFLGISLHQEGQKYHFSLSLYFSLYLQIYLCIYVCISMYIYTTLLSISYHRKHSRPVTTQIQCTNLARIDPLAQLRHTRYTYSTTPSANARHHQEPNTKHKTQNTKHKCN